MVFSLRQEESVMDAPELWCVAFSSESYFEHGERYELFATCGGPHVAVYEYDSANRRFEMLQSYTSAEVSEEFFAVTFAHRRLPGRDEKPILCFAGSSGDITIKDLATGELEATLTCNQGHIFDLKSINCTSNGKSYNLLCSCTRELARIWNLDTLSNVAILRGFRDGSIGDVLSCSWHPSGSQIVTGGGPAYDEASNQRVGHEACPICVWNVLDSPRVVEALQASSHLSDTQTDRSQFHPYTERVAASAHTDVHTDRVDCVDWFSDLILSKSSVHEIILWQPLLHGDTSIRPIKKYSYAHVHGACSFVRFSMFAGEYGGEPSALLAVGNDVGQVYLWDMTKFDDDRHSKVLRSSPNKKSKKKPKSQVSVMRGLDFSPDGRILVGCNSHGSVFLWSRDEKRIPNVTARNVAKPKGKLSSSMAIAIKMEENSLQTKPTATSSSAGRIGSTRLETSSEKPRAAASTQMKTPPSKKSTPPIFEVVDLTGDAIKMEEDSLQTKPTATSSSAGRIGSTRLETNSEKPRAAASTQMKTPPSKKSTTPIFAVVDLTGDLELIDLTEDAPPSNPRTSR